MKGQNERRKWIIGILAIAGAGLLSGCGNEKKVDYSIEGMSEEEQPREEGGKSGLTQFEGEESWKDTWSISVDENVMTDISVDAQVIIPQKTQMSVLEVAEPVFDAEYKKTVANRIFEEVYYGDITHLPKKDLEALREFWYGRYEIESETPITLPSELPEFQETPDNIENAGDTYTPVEEYTVNEYSGSYEGRMYQLSFTEIPPGEERDRNFIRKLKLITMSPLNIYEVCPEKFKEQKNLVYSSWPLGEWAENHCKISEEEAGKEAELFVEKLGLNYSVASVTYPLVWGTPPEVVSLTGVEESEDWEVNGYVFSFDLGLDDVSFVNFGMEEDYTGFWTLTDREEEVQYSLQARLEVYVTDQGIIRAEANNPVEITGILEDVELLPLETVKDIMKKKMLEQPEYFRFNSYYLASSLNEMELIYFRVGDKENPGKFSYIPTWRLATVVRDGRGNLISITNPILINAIDGSLISFYDET